jgi:hypothetical protein
MPNLRRVEYKDQDGRLKVTMLPPEALDLEAANGIPVGPPKLEELGLPLELEINLNNELFYRGILTASDAIKRRPEVVAALMAALKVDAGRIVDIYIGKGLNNGSQTSEEQSVSSIPHRGRRGAS